VYTLLAEEQRNDEEAEMRIEKKQRAEQSANARRGRSINWASPPLTCDVDSSSKKLSLVPALPYKTYWRITRVRVLTARGSRKNGSSFFQFQLDRKILLRVHFKVMQKKDHDVEIKRKSHHFVRSQCDII
jgi:hypothetical protein